MTTQVLTQAQPIVISPSLTHCHTIVVPSKAKDGTTIGESVRNAVIRDVCTTMGLAFGGFTLTNGIGGWVADSGQLVQECVTVVTSFAANVDVRTMYNLAEYVKTTLNQDCVMFTCDGAAYFA